MAVRTAHLLPNRLKGGVEMPNMTGPRSAAKAGHETGWTRDPKTGGYRQDANLAEVSSFELTLPDAEVRQPTDTPDADVRDWVRRNTNVFPIDDGFRAELSEVCAVGATGPNTGNVTGFSKTFTTAAEAEAWADDFAADSVL